MPRVILRSILYAWVSPWTLTAVAIGLLLGGKFRLVDGVVEVHGNRVASVLQRLYVPAMAITIGHVVLGQTQTALDVTRTHERVHVRQYERWGIAFVPAYSACYLCICTCAVATDTEKTLSRSKPTRWTIPGFASTDAERGFSKTRFDESHVPKRHCGLTKLDPDPSLAEC